MEYEQFRAMNSDIVLGAEGRAPSVARGFAEARAFIASGEARFTRFTETSELSRLNRSAGAWFQASPELFDVVQQARAFAEETDGLFDPTILDALEAAGYDKSMDDVRRDGIRAHALSDSPPGSRGRPGDGAASPARSVSHIRSAFRAIQLDEIDYGIHLPLGLRIDLGGIAKGWLAEQATLLLSEYTDACAVSAGGDFFAIGLPAAEGTWTIGLEDPRAPNRDLTTLHVGPGAVMTSSITKRRWHQGRHLRHHVIDPRTGMPANTDWLSVTVIAPHATLAEVYAKALLIVGTRDAMRLAEQRREITFIGIDHAGQLWGSEKSKEVLNGCFENA